MVKKIDHIAFAVHTLPEAISFYEKTLGILCERVEEIPSQEVRVAFLKLGEIYIELLEPTSEQSPVAKFLKKNGPGMHHVAYATDDIKAELQNAERMGCRLIHKEAFLGAANKLVAFVHPSSSFGVLTEFCQKTI